MRDTSIQMKGFPLAVTLRNLKGSAAVPLTNVNPESLKKPESADSGLLVIVSPENLIKPNTARVNLLSIVMVSHRSKAEIESGEMMTNDDAVNSTKPGIQSVGSWANCFPKNDCKTASNKHLRLLNEFGEFSDTLKKGSNNTAPGNSTQHYQSSTDSCRALRRCRCLTSRCNAETTNCPVVSPISFNSSTAFATSCGTRAAMVCDFALTDFVAITGSQHNRCSTVWQKKSGCKFLTCSTPVTNMVFNTLSTGVAQIAKPGSAPTHTGLLATYDSYDIEVVMFNSTTPAFGRVSLGSKNFRFRFLALLRADAAARPFRISIEATTELEARRVLAPLFILSLASRLPALEIAK